jgi:hydroxyacylglutathione hydrolase
VFFSRLYDRKLAQASYLVGCEATGTAIVIDPNRDAAQYIAAARAERLRIGYVTETHIHADFVSGARELAHHTGARLLLSGEGGADWQYDFAASANAQLLRDGDSWMVGNVRFDVLHTPGHTPEHLSFLLTDTPASPHPLMVFTGDFVFVGDVGRPDLLEKAAGHADTMEAGARDLWHSLSRFRALPDFVQVWPGHGAGSACGKALGAVPSSTVGYEKLVNWAVSAPDEESFVRMVLEGQPEPPAYFARMKRVNKAGPDLLGVTAAPRQLSGDAAAAALRTGAVIVDLRPAEVFARGHLPDAISVPLNRNFITYGGSLIPYDVSLLLVCKDDAGAGSSEAIRDLSLIGLDTVAGFVTPGTLPSLAPLAMLERVDAEDAIARHASGELLIDVRDGWEWDLGHVPNARHMPLATLNARVRELPKDVPILVQCQSGSRSALAASALRRQGLRAVDAGGITAWERSGGAVETSNAS